jgi:hypothetical protein
MIELLSLLKGCMTHKSTVNISNFVFRLHSYYTVTILLLFAVIVTSKQYIGDPIECVGDGIATTLLDKYCWTHSTHTIRVIIKIHNSACGV